MSTVRLDEFEVWDGAIMIPVDRLVLPEWNVNEMDEPEFAALVEAIQDEGFDEPCQVVPITEGSNEGKFLVLGGNHRDRAAVIAGIDYLPCVIKHHLTEADELELQEWSVKRNNIRGKLNREKYVALEQRIIGKRQISAEAARRRLLMREDLVKHLKATKSSSREFGPDDPEEVDLASGGGHSTGSGKGKPGSETDSEIDEKRSFAERRALLTSLKTFAKEVLEESGETADHGYLFFGHRGGTHLVVNESDRLNLLVSEMVNTCKANSANIDEFLISAITNQLKEW